MDHNTIMDQVKEQDLTQAQPARRSFPIDGTNLAKVLSDAQYRQSFHAQLKRYNPLIVVLYKIGLLPLFGASRTVMLLTTRGRKSRKMRSTPIGYFRIGSAIHLFSAWGKAASWYKNMAVFPGDVWIQIGLKRWAVKWIELQDAEEILRTIEQLVTESPAQAKTLFGWDPENDRLEQADFTPLINNVLIVRFSNQDQR